MMPSSCSSRSRASWRLPATGSARATTRPRTARRSTTSARVRRRRRLGRPPRARESAPTRGRDRRPGRGHTAGPAVRWRRAARRVVARSVPTPDESSHLGGDLGHLRRRLQVALAGAAIDVPQVERHQPAGGVEHVGDRGVLATGVPHGVGEHDVGLVLVRPPERACGERRRASDRVGAAVVDHLAAQRGHAGLPLPPPCVARSARRLASSRPRSESGPSSTTRRHRRRAGRSGRRRPWAARATGSDLPWHAPPRPAGTAPPTRAGHAPAP